MPLWANREYARFEQEVYERFRWPNRDGIRGDHCLQYFWWPAWETDPVCFDVYQFSGPQKVEYTAVRRCWRRKQDRENFDDANKAKAYLPTIETAKVTLDGASFVPIFEAVCAIELPTLLAETDLDKDEISLDADRHEVTVMDMFVECRIAWYLQPPNEWSVCREPFSALFAYLKQQFQ